jgi:hypothetical protein
VKISETEWIIIRDSIYHPAAIVRRLEFPDRTSRFRVVTWAEKSEDRTLLGYVANLELADMLVRFSGSKGAPGAQPSEGTQAQPGTRPRTPWGKGLTAEDWARRAEPADPHDGPPRSSWG